MINVIIETLLDSIKILPFLFVTYLAIEYMESKNDERFKKVLIKSRGLGPMLGSLLGIIPQCGFSAAAANFYAGRIITLGTMMAVFLSTSDEMLPVLLSAGIPIATMVRILAIKAIFGLSIGILIDSYGRKKRTYDASFTKVEELCEREQCHCEENGIISSAAKHAISIFLFIVLISLVLNLVFYYLGDSFFNNSIFQMPVIGQVVAGLIGIIPNCAASVLVTQLYVKGVMSFGAMIAGLLASAGAGLVVLFRVNNDLKENVKIVVMLYAISVIAGSIIGIFV